MVKQTIYDAYSSLGYAQKQLIVDFVFKNREEENIRKEDILMAVEYATKERPSFGGFILVAEEDDQITGVIIVNKTGMEGFSPQNKLTYFASATRKIPFQVRLLKKALTLAKGDFALQVCPDSPLKKVFEKLGFRAQYVEMRLSDPNAFQLGS